MQINEQTIRHVVEWAWGTAKWLAESKQASDAYMDWLIQQNAGKIELPPDQGISLHEQHIQNIAQARDAAQAILNLIAFNPPPPNFGVMFQNLSTPQPEPAETSEPPFSQDHYMYHTPSGPNPPCPNCAWLNWSQP